MSHLICQSHRRRVMVVTDYTGERKAIHRGNGEYCGATVVTYAGSDAVKYPITSPSLQIASAKAAKLAEDAAGQRLLTEIFGA